MRRLTNNKPLIRVLSVLVLLTFLNQIILPTALIAQSQGPAQVEHQSFSPSGSSEMVNIFSGDFNYSIPLMEVDGYPLVLGYNADVKLEQEASWVGLGWSLNPGALSRGVRGFPDDFNKDVIKETTSIKTRTNTANENGAEVEMSAPLTYVIDKILQALFAGGQSVSFIEQVLSATLGLNAKAAVNMGEDSYNKSYVDLVFDNGYSLAVTLNPQQYGGYTFSPGIMRGNSLGVSLSSRSGIGLNPTSTHGYSLTFGTPGWQHTVTETKTIGANYTTRAGLSAISTTQGSSQSLNVGGLLSLSNSKSVTTTMYPGTPTYTISSPVSKLSMGSNIFNADGLIVDPIGMIKGFMVDNKTGHVSVTLNEDTDSEALGFLYLHETDKEHNAIELQDFNRSSTKPVIPRTMTRLPYAFLTHDNYRATGSGLNMQFEARRNDIGTVHDPFRTQSSVNQTFNRRVARDVKGKTFSKFVGQGISKVANALFDVPPFIDEFVLKGGVNIPFEFNHGTGEGDLTSRMGGWLESNGHSPIMDFLNSDPSEDDIENIYFKRKGEVNKVVNNIGNPDEVIPPWTIDFHHPVAELIPNYSDPAKYSMELNSEDIPLEVNEREIRNTDISYLVNREASQVGFTPTIKSYSEFSNDGSFTVQDSTDKGSPSLQAHHLSEFTVTNEGGERYVYGTPVYNNYQREVVFSSSGSDVDSCSMTASYNPGTDNSTDNENGKMNYFKSITTPKHASTFLLDAVLSPDYIDVDGNGPSDNDRGSYTRFRYQNVDTGYNWRIPYSAGSASNPLAAYSIGYSNNSDDDMESYVYGSKELWYVHSVEGKTEIAEFYLSIRGDGHGVIGENGQLDPNSNLMKLDSIALYNKVERQNLGVNAEPIKKVHFQYDYSLCPGIPSNDLSESGGSGKLTLKKLYFTYGKSLKGAMSPYQFSYTNNYPYAKGAVDRWGNYKPNICSNLNNQIFPYSVQNETLANEHSKAWKLSEIALPSGARVNVYYESDTYGKVQHLNVQKMYNIVGFGQNSLFDPNEKLYEKTEDTYRYNNYVYFQLEAPMPFGTDDDYIDQYYIDDMEFLYFKVLGNLVSGKLPEYYYGYAEIESSGFCPTGGGSHTHGWIKLKDVRIVDENENEPDLPPFIEAILPSSENAELTNPIAKAGWQHIRLSQKELIYPEIDCSNSGTPVSNALGTVLDLNQMSNEVQQNYVALTGAYPGTSEILGFYPNNGFGNISISKVFSILNCMKQYFQSSFGMDFAALTQGGLNVALRNSNAAASVDLDKSLIKLGIPSRKKFGGGYRVAKITSSDSWGQMSTGSTHVYGQEYEYEHTDKNGIYTTSGVATYEPVVGNDENVWHKPTFYDVNNLLSPDDHHFIDKPVGEELFPSASVGYKNVQVQNLSHTNVNRAATGKKEYSFFTAADYPIRIYESKLESPPPIQMEPRTSHKNSGKEEYTVTIDAYAATQGFGIYLNDMHGKPRARSIYNQSGELRNKVKFDYHSTLGQTPDTKSLDNRVTTYNKNAQKSNGTLMGRNNEVTLDARRSKYETKSNLNSKVYNLSMSLTLGNSSNVQEIYKDFGSGVTFTLINEFGILEKTEIKDGSSTIVQSNLGYDERTGNPLLVSVQNDYLEKTYNFSYPAYWMHDGMGHAYENAGKEFVESTQYEIVNQNGVFVSYQNQFFPGDEIVARPTNTINYDEEHYWVVKIPGGNKRLIDRDGHYVSFNQAYTLKILRSGKRNQLTKLAGSISSLNANPHTSDSALYANAVVYSDDWQMYCGVDTIYPTPAMDSVDFHDVLDMLNTLILYNEFDFAASTSSADLSQYPFFGVYDAFYANWENCTSDWSLHQNNTVSSGVMDLSFDFYCDQIHVEDLTYSPISITLPSGQTPGDLKSFQGVSNVVFNGSEWIFDSYAHFANGDSVAVSFNELPFDSSGTSCQIAPSAFCGEQRGDTVNPYFEGVKGNYRPKESYVYYYDERKAKNLVETKKDGQFPFATFWRNSSLAPVTEVSGSDSLANHWLLTQDITKCDPYGNVLESHDALGLYSSSLMGYNYTKTIATAANAEYRQIAFDGFEDYNLYEGNCNKGHLNFYDYKATNLTSAFSHTGRFCLKVDPSDSLEVKRPMTKLSSDQELLRFIDSKDCMGTFSPYNDIGIESKYVVSYWQKLDDLPKGQTSYGKLDLDLEIDCIVLNPIEVSKSNLIDGWQWVEKVYSMPAGEDFGYIKVIISNTNDEEMGYFDDIRIHPYTSSMQSNVYDPLSNRLVAVLDDRNFATFFKYDHQGKMIATQKETSRGIFTLNESRNSITKLD